MLLTVILSLAFGMYGQQSVPEGLGRQIKTSELQALFVGRYFKRGELYQPQVNFSEHFRAGGEYLLVDERASDVGSYRIEDDKICVKLPGRPDHCRIVILDSEGKLRISDQGELGRYIVINLFQKPN